MTREDLRGYALDYYQHVNAFPSYLAAFALRLNDGDLRQAVLANMRDEQGGGEAEDAHSDLWMDFAEGMGAARSAYGHKAVPEVKRSGAVLHAGGRERHARRGPGCFLRV